MNKIGIKDIDVKGKVVIVRVDFNVPLKNGEVTDDNRIVAALPTIKYLQDEGCKIVLLSHLGKVSHKDEEKCKADMAKNDMRFVVPAVEKYLKKNLIYVPVTRGEIVNSTIANARPGQVILLQNTRYEKGEEKNNEELSTYWASLADAFIMDAFGSAHRAHASTYGIADKMLKENKSVAMGFLVEKEVQALSRCVEANEHPYVAVLGGVKVSDKIKVIEGLLKKADKIVIGGAMAYTFLKAQGVKTGDSLVEKEQLDFAKKCLEIGKDKIVLPIDHIIAEQMEEPKDVRNTLGVNIIDGFAGYDTGILTRKKYNDVIKTAKVIFWNGPMGVFENENYSKGTEEMCASITSNKEAFSVVGGGDSASAASKFGFKGLFSHVSTGGGASLEMIENDGHLPCIDIIPNK